MQYYRKIAGERLYLSPFDPEAAESASQWAEWMNDSAVAGYYGGNDRLVSLAEARKTVAGLAGYRFTIVLSDGNIPIGHASLHDVNPVSRNAFLGIFIGEAAYRGKGCGTEAVRLLLRYGFRTLNLHSIMLSVHADNHAAIRCYQKAGFQEAGRCREWVFKNGAYVDKLYMQILEGEFDG